MSYPLPPRAREIQQRVRKFVTEELVPWEVHAEMNNGEVPDDVRKKHKLGAREAGLYNMDIPVAMGGQGLSMLEQAVAQEQLGGRHQRARLVRQQPAELDAEGLLPAANQEVDPAADPRRDARMLRDHRGRCRSDVDAIKATARRDGDHYVLNGEKWHVTSGNLAQFMIFQAKLTDGPKAGSHCLFFVAHETPGIEHVRTPAYTHTYRAHHPIYRFTDVRVPAENRIGAEGDGMGFTYDWFRYERLMISARCCGAAAR